LKRQGSPGALLWGAALDVIFLLVASWFFRSIYQHAVRTGLIERYSAESLS
jgi:ABC-2 type transport system permease protein